MVTQTNEERIINKQHVRAWWKKNHPL